MRDIETIIQYAEQHGIDSEPDHEVGDLQDMLRTFWQKADEHTRQKFITSAEVTALLNMNEPDFTLILCPAHAENSLTLDCTEGWNDKCQIEHVRTVPTIEDMAWVCPECGHEIVHDYDALIDVGEPVCSACDNDIDMQRKGS